MKAMEILLALDGASDADLEAVSARLGLTQKPHRRGGMRILLAAAVAAALLLATLGVAMAASPEFRDAVYSMFHIQTREPVPEATGITDEKVQLWKHLELEDAAEIDYYSLRIPFYPVAEDTLYHWDEHGGVFYQLKEKGFEEIPATRVSFDVTFGGATQHIVYDWAKVNGKYLLGYREDPRMNENPYGYAWMLHQPDQTSPTVWLTLPDWSKSFAPCPFLLNLETGEWTDVLHGMEYERFREDGIPNWAFSEDLKHLLLCTGSSSMGAYADADGNWVSDVTEGVWLYDVETGTETDLSMYAPGGLLSAEFTDPETILLFCRINNEYRYTWYHVPDGTVLQKAYPADDEAWLSAGEKAFVRNTDGSVSLINLRTDEEIRLPDLGAESVYTLNDAENRVLCIDIRMYDSASGILSKNYYGFSVCDLQNHTIVRLDREPSDEANEWSVFWLDNERFAVWAENPADGFADIHVYRLHSPEA